jgi:hypothetical protein
MLRKIAEELEKRVINDQIGGWSTNHSEPMKKLAFSIWAQNRSTLGLLVTTIIIETLNSHQ